MAITEIDTATPTTGLKAGADIINGNFSDVTNAAAALVQTSATDTTAGRVLTTDRAGAAASPIWNVNNYQPEVSLGVGVVRKMKNKSGGSIADGVSTAGSNLAAYFIDGSGVVQEAGVPSGTWKNTSGSNVGNGNGVDFTRTA